MSSKFNTRNRQQIESLIQSIMHDTAVQNNEVLIRMLQGLSEDLSANEYRITIIGEFSSGKSTFINALLGRDILPHGVEETTAAVTYIHNVGLDNPKANTVEVVSNDSSISNQILNLSAFPYALIDYVTAKSTTKDVVKEIAEVHIYVPFMEGGEQVVLIDTPGLNGVKEGMRDITYREIHRSHANICLFHIKGASQSDLDFIEQFYKNGTPFFFVLNQIDALNEETPEERIEKFTSDIKNNIIHADEKPDNVFGISALMALTSRDHNIKRLYADDREDLKSEDRLKLLASSRIEIFENALYDFVSNGEIEKNFLENIISRLNHILRTSRQDAQTEIDLLNVKVSDLPEKTVLDKQRQAVEKSIDGNKAIIRNRLSTRMAGVEKEFSDSIRKSCDSIADEAERIVAKWTDLKTAEKEAEEGKVVKLINDRVNYQRTIVIKPNLEKKFDTIYSDLIDTVSGFVPSVHYSKKTSSWSISIGKEEYVDSSRLKRLNDQIQSATEERAKIEKEKEEAQNEYNELSKKKRALELSLRDNERSRQYDLSRLGVRPSRREWPEEIFKRKYFLGLISYQSKTIVWKNNEDDIREYDNERERIDRFYDAKASTLRATRERLLRDMDNVDVQMKDMMLRKIDGEIASLQHRKQREEEEIEFMRKNVRKELLDNIKKHTRILIENSITPDNGELYLALRDETRKNIRDVEQVMIGKLDGLYQRLLDEFRKKLSLMISKIEKKANVEGMNIRISELSLQVDRLDYYISLLNKITLN